MSEETPGNGPVITRKRLLLGGLAATIGGVFARPRSAEANTTPLCLGESNVAPGPTQLVNAGSGPALTIQASSSHAYVAFPGQKIGVLSGDPPYVFSFGTDAGTDFEGPRMASIVSVGAGEKPSANFYAITGLESQIDFPKFHVPDSGVYIGSEVPAGPAVRAEHTEVGGIALEALGELKFSSAGVHVLRQGRRKLVVPDPSVTPNTTVLAILGSNPLNEAVIQYVQIKPGLGFHVFTNTPVARNTLVPTFKFERG